MGWALIVSAMCVDLAQLGITWIGVVVVGGILSKILSVAAGFGFWMWFQMLGVSMSSNTRKMAVSIVSAAVEMVPGLDAIPILSWAWTAGMILTVIMTRMEDNGEEPSITGALKKITSYGQVNPGSMAVSAVRKRIFRKPQREFNNEDSDDTINTEQTEKVDSLRRRFIDRGQGKLRKAA